MLTLFSGRHIGVLSVNFNEYLVWENVLFRQSNGRFFLLTDLFDYKNRD